MYLLLLNVMEKNNSKDENAMCLTSTKPVQLDEFINNLDAEDSTFLVAQPIHLDEAIEMLGLGHFHYYLLFICGSLFSALAISMTSSSFIITSAQCDLKMTSFEKGLLNGASMIGMLCGCFITGYWADSKGRKYSVVTCMMIDGIFNLISSVSQIYPVLIFCRLMSGFGVSGCNGLYSYLGEFMDTKNREKYLCWLETFWTLGVILLPCIAWLIIPLTFRIEYGFFLFRSWNLFAVICALPSIIFSCLLIKFPESPKFLLSKGNHDETINCLKFVYRWNNKTVEKFPVTSLILPDCIDEPSKSLFHGLYNSLLGLFTSKFKVVAIIICTLQFCSNSSYYMLVLWFPELINRFRWYETKYSGPKNMTNMCEIMSLLKFEPEEIYLKCKDEIDQSVYENILIIGIACVPLSIIVPLIVNKFRIKFFLVVSFFGSGLTAAYFYFISSSFENLVLSSVFEALSSVGIGLVFCISFDLFPTEYRGFAIAISSMFGKLGAIIGNIVVGVFIDAHCMVPILVSCSFLVISGLLIINLPKTGKAAIQ